MKRVLLSTGAALFLGLATVTSAVSAGKGPGGGGGGAISRGEGGGGGGGGRCLAAAVVARVAISAHPVARSTAGTRTAPHGRDGP